MKFKFPWFPFFKLAILAVFVFTLAMFIVFTSRQTSVKALHTNRNLESWTKMRNVESVLHLLKSPSVVLIIACLIAPQAKMGWESALRDLWNAGFFGMIAWEWENCPKKNSPTER